MTDSDSRTVSEIRWSTSMQMQIAQTLKGSKLVYQAETEGERKEGYYVQWMHVYRVMDPAEPREIYLGSHLALVQFNIFEWIKERKGILERGNYR